MKKVKHPDVHHKAKNIALWGMVLVVLPIEGYALAASIMTGQWESLGMIPLFLVVGVLFTSLARQAHSDFVVSASTVQGVFGAWLFTGMWWLLAAAFVVAAAIYPWVGH